MRNKIAFFFLLSLLGLNSKAQEVDSVAVAADTVNVVIPENEIQNVKAMNSFLKKLADLKNTQNGKINIVHIGDSHIQADMMTGKTRKSLQAFFGNGGRGLVFPHSLAKTNGTWDIHFSSDANWESRKIVSSVDGSPVGLSGIALCTKSDNFNIELNLKEADNFFNTIKIITPHNEKSFAVATAKKNISIPVVVPKKVTHKIKDGEALSTIADKYNVSVSEIKRANGMKSDKIRAGKTLKIPSEETQKKFIEHSEFVPSPMIADNNCNYFVSDKPLGKIYLIPTKSTEKCSLNGIVLENNRSGIIYHNIGVNGAQLSDYNKYPIFFEQLKALQPDLIIVSLGTNESFSKMKSEDYMKQLELFLQNVKTLNPDTEFLVATPPPSLFRGKVPNVYVADYKESIIDSASINNYAVWNLYSQMGGFESVNGNFRKGLMSKDRVHYSKLGYEMQGELLSQAILKIFENYKTIKE